MSYLSSKTYGHEIGLSCAFRQWRADSHCKYLHGYALSIEITFEATELDERNWVVDFGSLKSLEHILRTSFDHKTIAAFDDPELPTFKLLERVHIIQLIIMAHTSCEKFAEYIYQVAEIWLKDNGYKPRVNVLSVKVSEHGANSATYIGEE